MSQTETALDIDASMTRSARGAQARAKLKRACLAVLEREGYHNMRIADVTSQAGVAQGLFYHYFKDLKSLTLEVLGEYVAQAGHLEEIEKDVERGNWYQLIYAHNLLVVRSYARRPGLMRCLFQMADEDVQFSGMLRESFMEQLNWLVRLMPSLFPSTQFKEGQALMVAYALAGAGETLLKEYFINSNPVLTDTHLTIEEVTELLATMFYRGLFLEHPPAAELDYAKNLANMAKDQRE